jgi:hypothetical protein
MINLLSRLRLTGWLTWLSILVLAAGPRLARLDGFVTADEVRWTCRTLNFREALLRGDWAATFQTGHPGVITMWLGSLMLPADPGAEVTRACHELNPGQIAEFEPWAVRSQLYHLLVAARGPVALALVLGVVAIYALARRLFGPTTAWLGAILIALDPFLLAHSRVLHLDGPLATLMTVSVLALLAAMLGGGVGGREGGTVRRPATARGGTVRRPATARGGTVRRPATAESSPQPSCSSLERRPGLPPWPKHQGCSWVRWRWLRSC